MDRATGNGHRVGTDPVSVRVKASVARLKANPDRWQEIQNEQKIYDNALMDGLETGRDE
jgi:hypothetical protein